MHAAQEDNARWPNQSIQKKTLLRLLTGDLEDMPRVGLSRMVAL